MDNTKIGNKEAVALLVTITFTHIILNITKIYNRNNIFCFFN